MTIPCHGPKFLFYRNFSHKHLPILRQAYVDVVHLLHMADASADVPLMLPCPVITVPFYIIFTSRSFIRYLCHIVKSQKAQLVTLVLGRRLSICESGNSIQRSAWCTEKMALVRMIQN